MSDSSGTPEETGVETLRAEQHEGSNTSTAGCPSSVEGSVTTSEILVDERQGLEDRTDLGGNPSPDTILTPIPSTEDPSPSTEDPSPSTEDPSTEDPSPSTVDSTPINEDPTPITEKPTDDPTPVSVDPAPATPDPRPPSSLRVYAPTSSFDDDAHSQSEGLPEGTVPPSPEADTFSDSYTHISPSPEEPPASMLTPETLGGEGLMQAGGGATEGEGLGQEAEESELSQRVTDSGKQADSPEGWEEKVGAEEKEEGDSGLRRRRTLLSTLEQIVREDEEEEEEEEFQLPSRGEEFSFSLNKCLLGAIILLGIGTVFFSGIFIDVDDDSEYEAYMDLRDAEIPVKQEWSNTEGPPSLADDDADLLNKLDKGTEQIADLQAQAQREELKVPQGQAMEGAMKEAFSRGRLQRAAEVVEE